jgi:uncharacterized protein YndB with AHSA1/START domain
MRKKKMTELTKFELNPELDLVIERVIDVSPELVWKAWTEAEHLKKWFVPAPWTISDCEIELRPGGKFLTVMRSPEGESFPNLGCFLEIVPLQRLVFTDALEPGFRPSEKPFFTAIVQFEAHGKGTKYTAIAVHKNQEGRKQHEDMGFFDGWGKTIDQLEAYAQTL